MAFGEATGVVLTARAGLSMVDSSNTKLHPQHLTYMELSHPAPPGDPRSKAT